MPTVPENAPSSTTTSNGVDCEPDDAWKENLKKKIEEGLQSMVADAKQNHSNELSMAPDTEARIRLEAEYQEAMKTIKGVASDQFKLELERERNQRRWTAGVPITPAWTQYFHQEQQNIMNSIKQSNQTDNSSVRTASESPTEERRSTIPKPSNEPPAQAHATTTSTPVPLPVRPAEERDKSFVSSQSVRRGSDVRSTMSGDRDESGSFRRNHHASVHVRPGLPVNWVASETVDEPEELLRSPPPPRARVPSVDRPSQQPSSVSPDIRWDSSLGRSSGSIHSSEPRSPPRAPPQVWTPATSPAEDALPPSTKPYNLGRRGSSTSMRSTGSGASIRPSITETIPERADDDGIDESDIEENDYGRVQDTIEEVRPRISTTTTNTPDRSRDKVKRPHLRRNSRQSSVDAGGLDLGSSGLRSDDRHRPIDNPGKPPPYYDYREQSSPYPHRDQQVLSPPPQDPRPNPSRSSYNGGDDRDYGSQYSTPHRPHGPKPPPYFPQRESRPISRQVSFTRQQLHLDLDDDDILDRGGGGRNRDRETHWDRDYDRDRDRDGGGGRDIHSAGADLRRSSTTTYPYSASRHSSSSSYSNPSTTTTITPGGGSSRPPLQDYDVHEDWDGVPGPRYNNYRGPPPLSDNLEYQRRPDSTRPGPGLSRQSSYVRLPPRDDTDRRYSGDNDGYSSSRHHFSTTTTIAAAAAGGGSIPTPRHTPSLDEQPLTSHQHQHQQHQQQQPAWREWATESNRHPNYDHHQQQVRSPPPPSVESTFSPRRFLSTTTTTTPHPLPLPPQQSYTRISPHDDRPPPSFSGREMSLSRQRGGGNSIATSDEYDSADEDTDSEEREDDDDDEDNEDIDDDDNDNDDDDSSEEGIEAKRLRDLEARKQRLEENRRVADDELRRMELEIQHLAGEEARKKKEDEERREEVRRKEEEARRREEEARKKEEEIWRMEEEVKRKEEDAARKAEEAKKMEEVAKKKEAEAKRKEREARVKEKDAKKKEEEARRKVEEARQKAEELNKKEEEAKQREAQLEQDAEKTKQMQLETQKYAENLRKKEEEAHKKDKEMKEREDILRRREEELMRREADNFRREEEAKKKEEEVLAQQEEEARKREELKEKVRRDEEAKLEALRRKEEKARQEEVRREEGKKRVEARRAKARQEEEEVRKEEARKREEAEREEARKKAEEAKREEEDMRRKLEAEEAKRKADEAAKWREEDSRRREDARLEGFRREQEEKRLQNESQHFEEMFFDLDPSNVDSKLMDEQLKVLQQAEFRKRVEDIRRTREERKRNDSIGNDSAWPNPSHPSSNSPGTSPSMSRSPPQFNGPPAPERSAGTSTGGWGAGSGPAWGPSIKPTAAAASPTASRSSTTSTSTGKPRTGSVSSGTYPTSNPTSSSPHTASFSEAERTRKQQEFAESQQEQFRRAQEKLEAERQLKSAGRPLSREELQRVFEHHERLWTRLNTLSELSWNDFPWPMAKPPSNPDDMSLPQISAYIQSPLYPDKDKTRTTKDRIKEHIKKWHPDRFETKLLPKVVEDEREKVKHGAGNVARYLSDLLRKENESNNNNIFGD